MEPWTAMLSDLFTLLQDHSLLAKVALAVVTAIGFLHLLVFFLSEIKDVAKKVRGMFFSSILDN